MTYDLVKVIKLMRGMNGIVNGTIYLEFDGNTTIFFFRPMETRTTSEMPFQLYFGIIWRHIFTVHVFFPSKIIKLVFNKYPLTLITINDNDLLNREISIFNFPDEIQQNYQWILGNARWNVLL